MKSSSDNYPELTVQSAGKTQVRYNIVETTRTEMDGKTRTVYDFDYVEIDGEVSKEKVVEAILLATQPKETEPETIEPEVVGAKIVDPKIVEEAIIEADVIVKQGAEAIAVSLGKPEPVKEAPIGMGVKESTK